MAARALFAAPGALRALRGGRRGGTVELVLSGGVYLRVEEDWVLVTEAGAVFGPLSIAVAGLERGALHPGQRVSVRGERLEIGNQGVSLERVRERRPAATAGRPAGRGPDGGADGRSLAGGPFAAPIGAPPVGLAPGLRALVRGRVEQAVRLLAGRGDGLTPGRRRRPGGIRRLASLHGPAGRDQRARRRSQLAARARLPSLRRAR